MFTRVISLEPRGSGFETKDDLFPLATQTNTITIKPSGSAHILGLDPQTHTHIHRPAVCQCDSRQRNHFIHICVHAVVFT